jgi:uncharacterized metal-binding protein YceD (DUF177 family)
MTDTLPLTHSYNLARLGNAGDVVTFAADDVQREAIARWAGLLSLQRLDVQVTIKKLDSVRFGLDFKLDADVTQACVVTLEPVPARLDHSFHRELHFAGTARHKADAESVPEVVLDSLEEEGPEQISSLYYDLAAPALEEFVLSLEPYPRRPGVEFAPPSDGFQAPESPFAVLKSLK